MYGKVQGFVIKSILLFLANRANQLTFTLSWQFGSFIDMVNSSCFVVLQCSLTSDFYHFYAYGFLFHLSPAPSKV